MTVDDRSGADSPRLTAKSFHEAPGVEDWRVLFWGAYAFYRTTSFTEGARLVAAIAEAADAEGHEPDVDLRPDGVTIRTFTHPDGSLGEKDAALAARISAAARALGIRADPHRVQQVGIAVAQGDGVDTRPFWAAAFGYEYLYDVDAIDTHRRGPHLWFHDLEPSRPGRGRTHIDISLPADVAQQRVDAALAAGGRLVRSHAPHWWTIASPDNHGIDIAAWPDFEDHDEDD